MLNPSDPISGGDEAIEDDLAVQLAKIADQLSTLSEATELPSGFTTTDEPFEAADVSFDSGSWLLRMAQVQAWLHLDETISIKNVQADPYAEALKAFEAMGVVDPKGCLETVAEVVRPTSDGAEFLSMRCDSAVYLQGQFNELRDNHSRAQASDQWGELWEEESESNIRLEPILAKTDIWPIIDFAGRASKGRLNLSPTYQRGDVWPTGHCQLLIVSILRGIPLPSIILLRPQGEGATGAYEVVDGKQRLTSILRFMGKHPDALRLVEEADQLQAGVDFKEMFDNDYKKFKKLWKTHRGESLTATKEAEYYFPFRLPKSQAVLGGPLEDFQGKYFCEIRDLPSQVGGGTVGDVFETTNDYKVPVIEYIDATPRQVHEVFNLYNRQGKHLTAEEIRNALYHRVKLMRLLLAASGDNSEMGQLAPYVPPELHWKIRAIGETLTSYKFGTARFKRTKLISWLAALILQPSLQDDDKLAIRSTAKHINEMLARIDENRNQSRPPRLELEENLLTLLDDLHLCLETHSSCEVWAPEFQDNKDGSKWQELQLVASLVGVFLVCQSFSEPADHLEAAQSELVEFTAAHGRPAKTQNKTQWGFIGRVALEIPRIVGCDFGTLEETLQARYGFSCIPTLVAAAEHYDPNA